MGSLASCVKEIADTRFEQFPRSSRNIIKIVSGCGYIHALNKSGVVYTTCELARNVHLCQTSSDHVAVKALILLDVITKDQAKEHGKKQDECERAKKAYYAATCDVLKLKEAGINLTKSQKARLKELHNFAEGHTDSISSWWLLDSVVKSNLLKTKQA